MCRTPRGGPASRCGRCRWSVGTDSVLTIPAPAIGVELLLDLTWFSAADAMAVRLDTGGKPEQLVFDHAQATRDQTFIIPPPSGSALTVHIHVDRPFHAGDGRDLGVGINRARLRVR